jgi:hypothetical protein
MVGRVKYPADEANWGGEPEEEHESKENLAYVKAKPTMQEYEVEKIRGNHSTASRTRKPRWHDTTSWQRRPGEERSANSAIPLDDLGENPWQA